MIQHYATQRFWKCYLQLPRETRRLARKQFLLMVRDPHHPSLRFAKKGPFWSVRVGGYRALAEQIDNGFRWFWIGSHDEYDRLLRTRR